MERDFAGILVTIEYSKGTQRTLRKERGEVVYDRHLVHDYGFIRGTVGRDGDEVDVILGPDESVGQEFIVDMIDLGPDVDKRQDEDKVLLGLASAAEAEAAFCAMYPRVPRRHAGDVARLPFQLARRVVFPPFGFPVWPMPFPRDML